MDLKKKSKEQLIRELEALQGKVAEVERLRQELEKTGEEMKSIVSLLSNERKKTETIIAAIGDGISIQDTDFKVVFQNEAHRRIVGGSKIGEYCYRAYANSGQVCSGCLVAQCFQDGMIHTEEKFAGNLRKPRFLAITASPLRDSSGKIIAGIEVVRDITVRRQMEKALQESEIRYRTLFESAGDAIFILEAEGDDAGHIVAANSAAAEMHGYRVDELLSMNITKLDTEPAAQEAPERIRRVANGEWIKAEIEHRRKDGSTFPVEITAGPLTIGGHKYALAFDRDITRRKRNQEEKEALIRELQNALDKIKTLKGLLPICAWCKKVRDDHGYWKQVEEYIEEHSDAMFTHGICPECLKKNDPDIYDKIFEEDK